jgi:hypothetical protein
MGSISFRQFCTEKWYEHRDELMLWEKKLPQYDADYYFSKHKWFLKNIYKVEVLGVDKRSQ